MENQENLKEKDILEIIYNSQEEQIDEIIKKANKEIKEELKTINTETAIDIKITKCNKEMYKQGFIDGINLMINCLKSKEK